MLRLDTVQDSNVIIHQRPKSIRAEDVSCKHWSRHVLKCKFVADNFIHVCTVRTKVLQVLRLHVSTGGPILGYGDFSIPGLFYWQLLESFPARRWVLWAPNWPRYVLALQVCFNTAYLDKYLHIREGYFIYITGFAMNFSSIRAFALGV